MIYENNINVIVMICNEIENGNEKCANYWDEKNKMKNYQILVETKPFIQNQFIYRDIRLINTATKKERMIRQIQFTGWQDHRIPGNFFIVSHLITSTNHKI